MHSLITASIGLVLDNGKYYLQVITADQDTESDYFISISEKDAINISFQENLAIDIDIEVPI